MAAKSPTPFSRPYSANHTAGKDGWPPLLPAKLMPPRLPRTMVPRESLSPRLELAAGHPLTVVQAPGGFGKTALCAAWFYEASNRGLKPAWVSFDQDDDEPRRAIFHVLGALDRAMPGLMAEAEALLSADAMAPVQSVSSMMVNAVLSRPEHFLLFLDDFHLLNDPQVLQFFSYALLHCPDNLHFIIAGQTKPRLPLAYLQEHNALQLIEADDLRFSADETAMLLGNGPNALSAQDIAVLQEAMAGWVMGLEIAAAAMRNNRDAMLDIGVAGQGAQWLGDYLKENIFEHLPGHVQQFLLRCSMVKVLTPGLCDRLAGTTDSAEILAWLAEQNLFIQTFDDAGPWYRLHPVFREFLTGQLHAQHAAVLPSLHHAASEWFAEHEFWAEAIRHALESGELERAADWVDQFAIKMVERSEITTLLHWIARLPDAPVSKRLSLRIAQAWALSLTFKPQAAELLDELEATVSTMPPGPETHALKQDILGVRTIFTSVYEDRSDEALKLAMAHMTADTTVDSFTSRAVRNVAAWANILAGDFEAARAVLRPLLARESDQEQIFPMSYRQCILGFGYQIEGQLAEAERIFRASVAKCEQRIGSRSVSATFAACCLAQALYEQGALDEAEAILFNRFPLVDEACYLEAAIAGYRTAVRLRCLARDRAGAVNLLERAEQVAQERSWQRMLAACAIERIRAGLPLTFDPFTAFPEADEANPEADPAARLSRLFRTVSEARCMLLIQRREFEAAQPLVTRLVALAEAVRSYPDILRLKLMQAVVVEGLGDVAAADEIIADAIRSAAERGFVRTVKDTLPIATLRRFATSEAATQLIGRAASLLAALVAHEPRFGRISQRHEAPPTIFSVLTSREIDILTGVAAGRSNKEVARQLFLTPETVKWHMKNILRKLNVSSRGQAVERATRLGLTISN